MIMNDKSCFALTDETIPINKVIKTIALMHKREEETYFIQRYESRTILIVTSYWITNSQFCRK